MNNNIQTEFKEAIFSMNRMRLKKVLEQEAKQQIAAAVLHEYGFTTEASLVKTEIETTERRKDMLIFTAKYDHTPEDYHILLDQLKTYEAKLHTLIKILF